MKIAIIIGAGPAGLAAAYELIKSTDVKPIIIERESQVGGLAKTVVYKDQRLDIGPHRFFSKVERVNNLWQELLPILEQAGNDKHLLRVKRLTRILFLGKLFSYPISLSFETLRNLGIIRALKIMFSYLTIRLKPIKPEVSLEDFFINRFGRHLYRTFFKDYTEKVWGVTCADIPRDWGTQRIKNLSILKAIIHFIKKPFGFDKNSETSLIEEFYYPLLGAGQMYEEMARHIIAGGGEIRFGQEVMGVETNGQRVKAVMIKNDKGDEYQLVGDYFLSSMAIKDLLANFSGLDDKVREVASGLVYRDYIIVGLLFKKIIGNQGVSLPDNWLYIQEQEIKMGRLDIFNNFSPKMTRQGFWLGAEYFCNQGDDFWSKSDEEIKNFAISELEKMNLAIGADLLDWTLLRVPKAYPAYFGSYDRFGEIKDFVDGFENLFLIGRNGMHRYNNMDHSILCGLTAADNIRQGIKDKSNLWEINTEEEYHEKSKS